MSGPGRLSRWRRLGLVLVAGAAAVGAFAADHDHNVAMVPGADADIRLTVPGGRAPHAGFLPMRVRIVNRSGGERTWRMEVIVQMQAYGTRGGQLRTAHTFTVPGSETREFFTFTAVPGGADFRGGSVVQVELEGPEVARAGRFMLGLGYGWNAMIAPVALEPTLEPALRRVLEAVSTPTPGTPRPRGRARPPPGVPGVLNQAMERVSMIDPAAWPADWRLWSSFGIVILPEERWARLDTARRQALLDWVALGGKLLLSPEAEAGPPSPVKHGAGRITALPRPLEDMDFEGLRPLGLTDARFNAAGEALASGAFWDLDPAKWAIGTKAGWLTGFVILFGVLVAPVNLFYFAPAGRRHRLFVTVPLLSIAASAVLFAVITVSDGFGGTGARRTVVVLLPDQNQAAVFQRQISRTGLLGGRDFEFPGDGLLDREPDVAAQLGGSALELRREGGTASGDWFSSRTVQQHTLRRLIPSRERVELVSGPGVPPVVQSTVATTLREFAYRDRAGRFWHAPEVPPGARVALRPGDGGGADAIARGTTGWSDGTFQALGGRSVEIPLPTLPGIRWDEAQDRVLYTGVLRGSEAAP